MPALALPVSSTAPKWYEAYTANRLPTETRHKIVDALAAKLSIRRICRELKTSEGTIKAVAAQEASTIAERKSALLNKFFRLADKALDRAEDTISTASHGQAIVTAGISTERGLLLAGEPTQHVQISLNPVDIYSELQQIQANLIQAVQPKLVHAQVLTLPNSPSQDPTHPEQTH